MFKVPKKEFPVFWKKNKPPKVLFLYEYCEGYDGERYVLTNKQRFRKGEVVSLEVHDNENAYYSGLNGTIGYVRNQIRFNKIEWLD